MKAVVTGGSGFIGSHLVEALIESGADVHVVDNLSSGCQEQVHPKATLHVLDIRSTESKELILFERPDVVFHLAAQVDVVKSIKDPVADTSINILGTVNMLSACSQAGVKKFIYASSSAVYGDLQAPLLCESDITRPISFYGVSKLTPELYIRVFHQLYGLSYTILRYANVYGPRQKSTGEGGVIAIFLDRIKRGLPLLVYGNGEQTRDFVYVHDVVKANLAAVQKGDQSVFHVGTARRTSINQLIELLNELYGAKSVVLHESERPGDIKHSCLDNTKIRNQLGWAPQYNMITGLQETFKFVMRQA